MSNHTLLEEQRLRRAIRKGLSILSENKEKHIKQ